MSSYFKESWAEFWAGGISKLGVIFLLTVVVISIYTLLNFPLDYGTRYWNNPKYWADNPKASMPVWVNLFTAQKFLNHFSMSTRIPSKAFLSGGHYLKFYNVSYELTINQFPTFITIKLENVVYYRKAPSVKIIVQRPDGRVMELYTFIVESPVPGEKPPYVRYSDEPKKIILSGNTYVAMVLSKFLAREYKISVAPSDIMDVGYEAVIFGYPGDDGKFKPLKGIYNLSVVLYAKDGKDKIGRVTFVVGGQVYGLMGTDTLGRDLAQGLLFGFPVALLIGFTTSFLTTLIGASLGIVGGYMGGKIDDLIQRVSDVVNNLPQLPLLIFLTFIFGGKLWIIVAVLIAFGWPNLVIVVRSMILQIKSSPFVEAAVSIGASKWRIMARHIFPQVAPYILSQMIFYTPSAILSEAALSFLGLGDPSIPTWGQILEYGLDNGAVYLGYWWWILPPGLLIVFSAVTFVLIALGLEPVVNPRLRRWR